MFKRKWLLLPKVSFPFTLCISVCRHVSMDIIPSLLWSGQRPKGHCSLSSSKTPNTTNSWSCQITSLHCSTLPLTAHCIWTKVTEFTVTTSQVSSPNCLLCPPCHSHIALPCFLQKPVAAAPLLSPSGTQSLDIHKAVFFAFLRSLQRAPPERSGFSPSFPFVFIITYQFLIFYYVIIFEFSLLHAVPSTYYLLFPLMPHLGLEANGNQLSTTSG